MARRPMRKASPDAAGRDDRTLLWVLVAVTAMGLLCQVTSLHYRFGVPF